MILSSTLQNQQHYPLFCIFILKMQLADILPDVLYKNSADADGGPRSRVRTAGHSTQPPIDESGNLSAHMSA